MKGIMEQCDYRGQGALRILRPWSIVMRVVMEHCDDKCPGTL